MKTLDRIAAALYESEGPATKQPFGERAQIIQDDYRRKARIVLDYLGDNLPDDALRVAEARYWGYERVMANGGMKNAITVAIDAILEGEA